MALGIRNPHAGPQVLLYAADKDSDDSESKSSFDGGDKQAPQITDRSSGAKQGLLNSEQKLPGME